MLIPDIQKLTPYRKSKLQFDLNNKYATEPPFSMGRPANLMFKNSNAAFNSLSFTSGWGIKAYHEDISVLVERTEADGQWLRPGNATTLLQATIASGFEEVFLFAPPSNTEMPNALAGGSSNLATQGLRAIRKSAAAGTDFSTVVLSADQAAFPFSGSDNPYGIDNTVVLDRVFVSRDNDSAERDFICSIFAYGTAIDGPDAVGAIYFTGPAGDNTDGTGQGLYRLKLTLSGTCYLFERLVDGSTWVKRTEFNSPVVGNMGATRIIYLRVYKSKACSLATEGPGGYIKFDFLGGKIDAGRETDSIAHMGILSHLAMEVQGSQHASRFHYSVPNRGTDIASVNAPLRIDFRRDLMGSFNIAWFTYPTTLITVDDGVFKMPFSPENQDVDGGGNQLYPFTFSYTACKPAGTTCYATLHRADTGAELTSQGTNGQITYYKVPKDITHYFVRWHIQAVAGATPQFYDWRVSRPVVLTNTGESSWFVGDASHPKSALRGYTIKGAERDLSQASADIKIVDPLNKCTELTTRANGTLKLTTQYSTNTSLVTCLHMGFFNRVDAYRQKSANPGKIFPVNGWHRYNIKSKGMWQLLEENFVDTPFFTLMIPQADGTSLPWKVTDLIKELISRAGFDLTTNFDFPDLDIRVYPSTIDYSNSIDMLEKLSQVVKSLARDYLSQVLIHDPNNIQSSGIWRLFDVPIKPYVNVAAFTMGDVPSPPRLGGYLNSYGTVTIPDTADHKGVTVNQYPCNEVKTNVRPPEANWLMCASIGVFGDNTAGLYHVTRFNELSYNAGDATSADPTSPDYLGRRIPLYVIDPALAVASSQEEVIASVDALSRRIAELVFHGIKVMTFHAPIITVPNLDILGNPVIDAGGTWMRSLRYYDPVWVDGTQWLIRNVNPDIIKDNVQWGMYELEAPRI